MDILTAILADPNVGAEFRSALASSASGQYTVDQLRRAAYVSAMIKLDHQFEHSDDQRVWRAGRDELQRLRTERAAIDADGALWAKHMHKDFQHES